MSVYGFIGKLCPLQALPESLTGTGKSQSFRSILLNTCQEEFEGAAQARAVMSFHITTPTSQMCHHSLQVNAAAIVYPSHFRLTLLPSALAARSIVIKAAYHQMMEDAHEESVY